MIRYNPYYDSDVRKKVEKINGEIEQAKQEHADPQKLQELYMKQLYEAMNLGIPWYRENRYCPY